MGNLQSSKMSILDVHYKYPFKVWLFILCLAPFLGIWLNAIRIRQYEDLDELLGGPFFLFLAGLFVSIPCFAIFFFLYRFLFRRHASPVLSKVLFSIFNVACVYLIFYLIGGEEMLQFGNKDGFLLVSSYAFLAIVGPLIFSFDKKL
jgi:hypothetical protein